jgi:hypothetical protein
MIMKNKLTLTEAQSRNLEYAINYYLDALEDDQDDSATKTTQNTMHRVLQKIGGKREYT